jgi:hypothetical protein
LLGQGNYFLAAQTVSDLTKKVTQAIGWNLDLSISSCGWSIPIAESSFKKTIWFRYDIYNAKGEVTMYTFLRSLLTIVSVGNARTITLFPKTGILPSFSIAIDPQWDIPVDTKRANVIIEIAPKGTNYYTPFM